MTKRVKIIVSGGGTAGHIYPAIAVVEAIKKVVGEDNCDVLFIGVEGKMECRIVPQYGYDFRTLSVRGLERKITLRNLKTAFNIVKSVFKARSIIKEFKPDVVMGFGGYVSAPVMYAASKFSLKRYIWEGNSFAGLANRLTARYADTIFTSFPNMDSFFKGGNILVSGSPIRGDFSSTNKKNSAALERFSIEKDKKVVLVTGGSLGARQINEAVMAQIDQVIERSDVVLIWQTGRLYYDEILERMKGKDCSNIRILPFLENISDAYAATDLIICRSGSSTVAEVAQSKIATLFVPSSGVTDDHQTKNAISIVKSGGAEMVSDSESEAKMIPMALELLSDDKKRAEMCSIIENFAYNNAAEVIATKILEDVKN